MVDRAPPGKKIEKDPSITKYIAMDCEMVGCGADGKRSVLARVSLVNYFGDVLYDKHVKVVERVTGNPPVTSSVCA